LLHQDIADGIIGAFYRVYNGLGYGFRTLVSFGGSPRTRIRLVSPISGPRSQIQIDPKPSAGAVEVELRPGRSFQKNEADSADELVLD
jgi:hypothetical protein